MLNINDLIRKAAITYLTGALPPLDGQIYLTSNGDPIIIMGRYLTARLQEAA